MTPPLASHRAQKERQKITHLSLKEKELIVTKALSQPERPLKEIAKESNIGAYSTLQS